MLEKDTSVQDPEPGLSQDGSSVNTSLKIGRHRISRKKFWIIVVIIILILLAVILGAVLGTFLRPGHDGPLPSVTEIPAGTTPTPTQHPPGMSPMPTMSPFSTSFAVTGWSVPGLSGYFVVWLFTQNRDGYLDRHTFNSSTGNWTRVINFVRGKEGTPLTALSFNAKSYANQPVCLNCFCILFFAKT